MARIAVVCALVAVTIAVCLANGIPLSDNSNKALLEDVVLIEDEKMIDNKICHRAILSVFHEAIRSAEGAKHNCETILEQARNNALPMMSSVCECAVVVSHSFHNVYDSDYDCVVERGVWNIREVSKMCSIPEPIAVAPTAPQNDTCVEGKTCIHGKCARNTCICDQTGANAVHPDWTGSDCAVPWCPLECSGYGFCNMSNGKCVCDSRHTGEGCEMQEDGTASTDSLVSPNTTAVNVTIPAPTPRPIKGICWKALALANADTDGPVDRNIPICNPDGSYTPLQCNTIRKMCWCVNEVGEAYSNTMLPADHAPACIGYNGAVVAPLTFGFKAPAPIITKDKCALLACGPNGYCDAKAKPVRCKCIGGYSGLNCHTPPLVSSNTTKAL
eukprot:c17567_g1_i1.p1 GENE.c17567_g1_i1~~c17567_g1_i1.p1  ORF type:complete len:387 (-),score=115.49 c17567_g1_i1:30-1190(-)